MIIIDGRQSDVAITSFSNLEELIMTVTTDESMKDRFVTDVFVNDEQFSEVYPHQAEDIESSDLQKVEIVSVLNSQMALTITSELYKVIKIMQISGREISLKLREMDNCALELLTDTVEVTRNFMSMIAVLRTEFVDTVDLSFSANVEVISQLLAEINEVLESQDWYLLADLLEFEFLPACQAWESVLANLERSIPNPE